MELTYWILICFAIITIMFFSFFTLYQRQLSKNKIKKSIELQKLNLLKIKAKKEQLLEKIDILIKESLLLVDDFDPSKSKISLTQIKEKINSNISILKENNLYKELKIQDPKWVRNLLINKLETTNPADWRKKIYNELENNNDIKRNK